MNLIPAIDLIGGKAVRLMKGDYQKVTVYSDSPLEVTKSFEEAGAEFLHVVDLDGAKDGTTANFETICSILKNTSLLVEIGGGIRNLETIKKYVEAGAERVILGTAAVTDPEFLRQAVSQYGEHIAVGVDVKDGMVAIKGWTEVSALSCFDFCKQLEVMGVKTVICTDISKDGMMSGTNLQLYRDLANAFSMNIIASGGVSSEDDIRALIQMRVYGAILGKALYTGAVDLKKAIAMTKGEL